MHCPYCGYEDQKVLDSRSARDGEAIRRRRECLRCERRFTTFEEPERPRLLVVKRDGSRADFNRDKVLNSMLIAARKRRIPADVLREAAERVERTLYDQFDDEAPTRAIGDSVLQELAQIDVVAYVRFASVYKEFETLEDFIEAVDAMRGELVPPPPPTIASGEGRGEMMVAGSRFPVLGSRFSVLGSRFPVPGCRFSVAGSRLSFLGGQFPVPGYRFSVIGYRLSVLGDGGAR